MFLERKRIVYCNRKTNKKYCDIFTAPAATLNKKITEKGYV